MERNQNRMDGIRSSASGAATPMDEDVVLNEAPIAADVNMQRPESAPVDAADPRELDGGVTDRPTHAYATADIGGGISTAERQPIDRVTRGMKVIDAAGNEIGKVDFVKMGDPEAATVSPAEAPREGGLIEDFAKAVAITDARDLPESIAGEMLRVGYLRIDSKGWFAKDRFAPADVIVGITGDTVQLSVTKDELAEA